MVLIFMFGVLTLFFFWVLKSIFGSTKRHENHYVKLHQQKMHDDQLYNQYLEFCKSSGELPMEKNGFQELRRKEEELEKKIKNLMK